MNKKEGIFGSWIQYYFILHEDTLIQLDKKQGKPLGSIHMKVAKILPSPDKNDKLQMQIFNGTNDVILRASSIKELVEWTNALLDS